MLKNLSNGQNKTRERRSSTNNIINQAITHSIVKADNALKLGQYKDASKFYKYALRLSEMQFGNHDSVVTNLRLLLRGIEEFRELKEGELCLC